MPLLVHNQAKEVGRLVAGECNGFVGKEIDGSRIERITQKTVAWVPW